MPMFQPNQPQSYSSPVSGGATRQTPGLLGNDGIGSFLADLGAGLFTGNWGPAIGGAIGGGGVGQGVGKVATSKAKGDGEEEDPDKKKTPNEMTETPLLASETMAPELGQTLASIQQPYRDPMKWWTPDA